MVIWWHIRQLYRGSDKAEQALLRIGVPAIRPLVRALTKRKDLRIWMLLGKFASGNRFRDLQIRTLEVELISALDACPEESCWEFFQLMEKAAFLPTVKALLDRLGTIAPWKDEAARKLLANLAQNALWECPRCGSSASPSGAAVRHWQCEECGLRKNSLEPPKWGKAELQQALRLLPTMGKPTDNPAWCLAWDTFADILLEGSWRTDFHGVQAWAKPGLPLDVEVAVAHHISRGGGA